MEAKSVLKTKKLNKAKMSFEQAQEKVIKKLQSDPVDCQHEAMWRNVQCKYAREMSEEAMNEVLKTKPKPDLTDECAKHNVAQMIWKAMR